MIVPLAASLRIHVPHRTRCAAHPKEPADPKEYGMEKRLAVKNFAKTRERYNMEAEESTVCKSEGLSIIGVIPIIIKWKEALKSNAKTRKERMEEIQNGVHQNQFAKC